MFSSYFIHNYTVKVFFTSTHFFLFKSENIKEKKDCYAKKDIASH